MSTMCRNRLLVGIIAPRIEETFELVRNRLEASGFDKVAGRRVVLTGGACQLHGAREFAGLILDKQVRIGRPLRVDGLAEATGGPAFSAAVGLLHFAMSERAEAPRRRARAGRAAKRDLWSIGPLAAGEHLSANCRFDAGPATDAG